MSENKPQDDAAMSPASTGSVCEPVAWLVTGDGYEYATLLKEHAEVIAEEEDGVVVPLCRSPTLADAEREALERICEAADDIIDEDKRANGVYWQDDAAAVAVVRGLLERMGGVR